MKNFITVRIYFEYGLKVKNQTLWQKLFSDDFAMTLMKKAKAFDLHQVLNFNVNKGYFNKGSIRWGNKEVKHFRHPHVFEIFDTERKIYDFLKEQESLLKDSMVVIVKNEILIR